MIILTTKHGSLTQGERQWKWDVKIANLNSTQILYRFQGSCLQTWMNSHVSLHKKSSIFNAFLNKPSYVLLHISKFFHGPLPFFTANEV